MTTRTHHLAYRDGRSSDVEWWLDVNNSFRDFREKLSTDFPKLTWDKRKIDLRRVSKSFDVSLEWIVTQ